METARPVEYVDLDQMLATGLTARQLDYWATKGYLQPTKANPGSGFQRRWPTSERDVAALMVRLVKAGLAVNIAASVAREVVETGMPEASIADGITVLVEAVR